MLLCQHIINIRISNEMVYIFFFLKPSSFGVRCVFESARPAQFGAVVLQVLSNHLWQVATVFGQAGSRAIIKSAVFGRAIRGKVK